MEQFHGTTILSVRRGAQVALGGDGQVTLGNVVMKGSARKVRKLYQGKVLCGFAGATADAFTLLDRFEAKLEKHQGNLMRASVELAKDWRTDRMLRKLEAMLLVGVFAYLLSKWRVARLPWWWFVLFSLFGSMVIALPIVLIWPRRRRESTDAA